MQVLRYYQQLCSRKLLIAGCTQNQTTKRKEEILAKCTDEFNWRETATDSVVSFRTVSLQMWKC